MTAILTRPSAQVTEVCTYCRSADVTITVRGAVSIDSADSYTGIDGNGDPVCPECWCGVCELGHADVDEREACESGEGLLPCDPEYRTCPDRLYDASREG